MPVDSLPFQYPRRRMARLVLQKLARLTLQALSHFEVIGAENMRYAANVRARDGILGIFPEAGSWARVLRPARPGTAFLAAETSARLLPIGITGLNDVFPHLRRGKRARVTIRIGQPFGPFYSTARGRARRKDLDDIGHEIMRNIAALIPPAQHGIFASDPAQRTAAASAAVYPWGNDAGV